MGNSNAFWARLGEGERASLKSAGTVRKYQPGEALIQAVSPDKNVVIILEGSARIIVAAGNGKAALLAIRGPGEIVGEVSFLDGLPRYATVEAASPVQGLLIRNAALCAAMQANPRIMDLLREVAIERLREADRRRVEYATFGVLSRTAALLLEFAERTAETQGPTQLDIITQADIAGLLATSRESVARALKDLRASGAIKTRRGSIIILDIRQLHQLAGR